MHLFLTGLKNTHQSYPKPVTPPQASPPVSNLLAVMMEGENQRKMNTVICWGIVFIIVANYPFCFVFNFLWPFSFYTINFSGFGSITCQVIYHLISDFFTDARVALPFPLGCRFSSNKRYWWFPLQKSRTTWKRTHTSLFPPGLFLCRSEL